MSRERYSGLRISGHADTFDVITAIAGLEMVLKGMGHPVKLGAGVAAAEELLMK